MTVFSDTVGSDVDKILAAPWLPVSGRVVPETVAESGVIKLEATYVYADMANSTRLAQSYSQEKVAKAIRSYLRAATKILKHFHGEVRSFDGDRVMAIFIGEGKCTRAVKAAYGIEWAIAKAINPKLKEKWPSFNWTMHQGVGVDTGAAYLVNGGVRGDNDIVSVGAAPNVAAKLSEIRDGYPIHVTRAVHELVNDSVKVKLDKTTKIWKKHGTVTLAGKSYLVYGANYWRVP